MGMALTDDNEPDESTGPGWDRGDGKGYSVRKRDDRWTLDRLAFGRGKHRKGSVRKLSKIRAKRRQL